MGQFENFFVENREAFDDQELPFRHEQRFLKRMEKKRSPFSLKLWYGVAAGFIFLAMLSFFARSFIFNMDFVKNNSKIVSLSDISFKYEEVEKYYQEGIDAKIIEFKSLQCKVDKEQQMMIDNELKQFDKNYINLQVELTKNMNDERIINAMINNYQTKYTFLELVIDQIKENC